MLNQQQVLRAINPRSFELILLPTEACNFRCSYCYENFKIGLMKPEVITGVKNLLSRKIPELDFLEISWFGGEPLLAMDIIQNLSSHILKLKESNLKLHYSASMTTNGSLLNIEKLRTLFKLGIREYQISLDGDKTIHDLTRVTSEKKGTFDQIWFNLVSIHESDLDVNVVLRIHYTPTTYLQLDPLIDKINSVFHSDRRFKIFLKSVEQLGGPNNDLIIPVSGNNKQKIEKILSKKIKIPMYSLNEDYICYATKPNSLVIRSNGDIGKCTVALYDEQNKVGHITKDGKVNIDNKKLLPWIKGLETLDLEQCGCPYQSLKK